MTYAHLIKIVNGYLCIKFLSTFAISPLLFPKFHLAQLTRNSTFSAAVLSSFAYSVIKIWNSLSPNVEAERRKILVTILLFLFVISGSYRLRPT